jgi:hypothetical protein
LSSSTLNCIHEQEKAAAERRRLAAEERRNAPEVKDAMFAARIDAEKRSQREAHMLEVATRRSQLAEQARASAFRRDLMRREADSRREVRLLSGKKGSFKTSC